MSFPEKFITELVERSDIVEVVSNYVRLDKKSGSNLFGLCPFHSEKTPSFSVSRDKQIYHCFGCGKGGGVINFVMEIENLSFPEAVEHLARRAGMPLPEQTDDAESRKRRRMLELNRDAARFFYSQLSNPAGAAAVEYMTQRGIQPATARRFGLGAAPDSWDSLKNALSNKGYSDFEMFDAGLLKRGKKGGFYDAFRNRLMFPVIDVRGNVIGFSGRILGDGEPKYLNSPETLVFSKSRNLFALNLAKKSKSGYIILSEGNIDVVSLHQAGFDSAVASLGTSLTPEQARLISRYTNQVIIAYDGDAAGVKASQRAIGILEKLDINVKVLRISGAKDPDEFIRQKGADAFGRLLNASENQTDYRLNSILSKYDLSADEQKVAFLKEATALIAQFPGVAERQVYSMRVAELSGVRADVISDEAERIRKARLRSARKAEDRKNANPERQIQPANREFRYENPASAMAEEGVIRLIYLEPELVNGPLPRPEDFSSPVLERIFRRIRAKLETGGSASTTTLAEELTADEMGLLVSILQKPENLADSATGMADYINKIAEEKERLSAVPDFEAIRRKKQNTNYDAVKKKKNEG